MDAAKIMPALKLDSGKSLSLEEFHRLLYDYFEEKGILTDLRTHLRTQMIRVLKDSHLGNTITNNKNEMSPKIQAINLLIAEYLLQKQYHYSLSVFSTEVPLNTVFPNVTNELTNKKLVSKFKFTESDMWDILETLGFQQHSDKAKTVSHSYVTNSKQSLLKCIIATINVSKLNNQAELCLTKLLRSQSYAKDMHVESFVENLKSSGLSAEITLQILEYLNVMMTTEITRIKTDTEDQLAKARLQLEEDFHSKVARYKKKIGAMEESYGNEKEKLVSELSNSNQLLRESQLAIEGYKSLDKKYQELKCREINLTRQEDYYNKQMKVLIDKEMQLKKKLEEVGIEKNSYVSLKEKIDINEKLIEQITESHNREVYDKSQQTTENINLSNALLRSQTKQLQSQIDGLQLQNSSYLSRIQELALQMNTLMQELENSQQRMLQMGAQRIVPTTLGVTTRIVPPSSRRCAIPSYTGGGEEGRTVAPATPRQFRNLISPKELKRRLQQVTPIQLSTSSEEDNITDTVLQETKLRLTNLEKESNQIDEHFEKSLKEDELKMKSFSLLQDFHTNLTSIRQSLTRIFNKNHPTTSAESFPPQDYTSVVCNTTDPNGATKTKLLTDDTLMKLERLANTPIQLESSLASSDIDLNNSLSAVELELSPDISETDINPCATSHASDVWKSVGFACLVPFVLDIILF